MLRLIDEKGEQLGVMETRKAIAIARERELEVVVVSEKADPPVAKIVDLNKYVYKEQQRKKALAKNARATRTELKEMQFRPKIDNHDFEVKANKIKKFFLGMIPNLRNDITTNYVLYNFFQKTPFFDITNKLFTFIKDK